MEEDRVWLKTDADKIASLIADEAKTSKMLEEMTYTIRQLQSKNKFRLALLNQLQESMKK
jgi:hypothetical protein